MHLVLLYAHACEASDDPSVQAKAASAHQALHKIRRAQGDPSASKLDWQEWVRSPNTWLTLARQYNAAEPILATRAYEKYIKSAEAVGEGTIPEPAMCLEVAHEYAACHVSNVLCSHTDYNALSQDLQAAIAYASRVLDQVRRGG
jgi:hypothetical protein